MTRAQNISLATKALYGGGSIASGIKDTAFNVFLLFFYTQVAGLSGALAGLAIFIALLLDAVSDPLVGYWSDRFQSAWGRRHPFMYFAALPMGAAFYFLFNPPFDASQNLLFVWMVVFAVLVRFFMTFYAVPSSALIAEMTANYDERTTLSGYRVFLGWVGGLTFATIGYVVFFAPSDAFEDGRLNPTAYQGFALLGAS
ncbi:MAG: MFS transporter, partial [Pseudomonadota bacterium]